MKQINEMILRGYVNTANALAQKLNRLSSVTTQDDPGMATAEYAVVLVAATSFAAVLVAILKSDAVRSALMKIITSALNVVA